MKSKPYKIRVNGTVYNSLAEAAKLIGVTYPVMEKLSKELEKPEMNGKTLSYNVKKKFIIGRVEEEPSLLDVKTKSIFCHSVLF